MFKKVSVLLLAAVFLISFLEPVYANNLADLRREQREIRESAGAYRQDLEATNLQRNTVQNEIQTLDYELTNVTDQLEVINRELDRTQEDLLRTEEELDEAMVLREAQHQLFRRRVRAMYINGGTGYLHMLLQARDFSDLLNLIEYINRIIARDRALMDNLMATEALIEEKLEETRRHEREYQILAGRQTEQMVVLQARLDERETFFTTLQQDAARVQQAIAELEESDRRVQSMIQRVQAEEAARQRAASAQNRLPAGAGTGSGNFMWPLTGRISSGYGQRRSPITGRTEMHSGIDIPAPTGTNIRAAEAGVVISSGWMGGYGLTLVIDHGDGLSTLYAHASRLIANVGQQVGRGEAVALVGSTGFSTGPHLHFEVRVNGRHTNPLNHLN